MERVCRLESLEKCESLLPVDSLVEIERTIVEVFSSEREEMFRGEAEGREGSLRYGCGTLHISSEQEGIERQARLTCRRSTSKVNLRKDEIEGFSRKYHLQQAIEAARSSLVSGF